jgi:hypothetical protein
MRTAKMISEIFTNERDSSERLTVTYTNWGEPYAEGVRLHLHSDRNDAAVDLEREEVERLHAYLGRLLEVIR